MTLGAFPSTKQNLVEILLAMVLYHAMGWSQTIYIYIYIYNRAYHWNAKVVTLTIFSSRAASKVVIITTSFVIMTTSSTASDEKFVNVTTLLFQWLIDSLTAIALIVVWMVWLTHWGRDKMAAVSQTTLSNAFSWMKMLEFRLRFHWSLFLRVQLTIIQHSFR